jgi:hypothetical protein
MKKIIYALLSAAVILVSCHKDHVPEASFSADSTTPEVGQTVFFSNTSINGNSFKWDFGDGYISTEPNPAHVYTSTGSFNVVLTASGDGFESQSSLVINVQVPTLLVIEVREYYSDDLIPNASILLYPTLADWDNQTNSISEAFTDQNGVAVFSNPGSYVYYLDVWEATHDNYTLRSEDVGFIRTPQVVPHQITAFTAYVDVANHSSGKGNRQMVVKKLERKATDKNLLPPYSGTQKWEEFYPKAVK